jgi:hypothetical protein
MKSFCPVCKNTYNSLDEYDFIKDLGECSQCDHLRTDSEEFDVEEDMDMAEVYREANIWE